MDVFDNLTQLEKESNKITLYKKIDRENILKGIGRIPGEPNKELLDFLLWTNGASILDYCFLGIKNTQLGVDLDKFVPDLWCSNENVAGKVVGFMINSMGETFGYLIGEKTKL